MNWPDAQETAAFQQTAAHAADSLRLPLRNHSWRGVGGNWQGAGIGNSIDFQDHRPYLPGDDPRHINWQAYARTGNYSMKLYREEVSPRVDLLFDQSDSMLFDPEKRRRAFELLYFSVESALRTGASLRCYGIGREGVASWPLESLRASAPPEEKSFTGKGGLESVPWRADSLRVWITDLLFDTDPGHSLGPLSSGRGRGVLFAVHCEAESSPDWDGNIEFEDCESGIRQSQHISSAVRTRYRHAYARHFSLWEESARRHAMLLTRVAAEPDFAEALEQDALPVGALEWGG